MWRILCICLTFAALGAAQTKIDIVNQTSGNLPNSRVSGGIVTSLNGLTGSTQAFTTVNDTNVTVAVGSTGATHTFTVGFTGTLAKARQHAATAYTDANNTFGAFRQSFTSSATEPAIRLIPYAGDPSSPSDGDIWYSSSANKFRCRVNGSTVDCDTGGGGVSDGDKGDVVVSSSGAVWTIDSGAVGDSKVASGVAATKIGAGSVDNTEFGYLNGVTSAIQTQLDAKAGITRTAVTHSATPTYTRSSAVQQWTQTLTSNVTSSTLSGAAAGDLLSFELTQDGTGSRTWVGPTGFPALVLCATAASRTTVEYFWTGSAAVLRGYATSGCSAPAIVTDAGNVVNVPDANDTLVTLAGTQTLTNKSLTSPVLTNGTNGQCVQKNASTGELETSGAACGGASLTAGTDYVKPSLSDTYANIAAATCGATETGRLGFTTDSLLTARCSGSAWAWRYGALPVTLPPTTSWTWGNQGGATETQAGGMLYLSAPAASGNNVRARHRTSPSAPWTLTALIVPNVNNLSNQQVGILVRGSGTGRYYLFGPSVSASTTALQLIKNNSETSWNATTYNLATPDVTSPIWLRVNDNNTNIIFSYSRDGINFVQVYSEGRTTWLTPDQIGYFAETQSTTLLSSVSLLSWQVQ